MHRAHPLLREIRAVRRLVLRVLFNKLLCNSILFARGTIRQRLSVEVLFGAPAFGFVYMCLQWLASQDLGMPFRGMAITPGVVAAIVPAERCVF